MLLRSTPTQAKLLLAREMSQQAVASRGAGRGGRKKSKYFPLKGGRKHHRDGKGRHLPITKIVKYTFNTGKNKFATQFTKLRERVAGYVPCRQMEESYLVAKTIKTGTAQKIALPAAVDPNAPDVKCQNSG